MGGILSHVCAWHIRNTVPEDRLNCREAATKQIGNRWWCDFHAKLVAVTIGEADGAVYARVSTDDQKRNGYSLPEQIRGCLEYAVLHHIRVLPEWVFQEDYTGAELDRPQLDELRSLIEQNSNVKVIIVYDLDRLSRDMVHIVILEQELARFDAKVHYVIGQYDDSDEGQLSKEIRGAIGKYERAKIKERMSRGKRGKARAGHYVAVGPTPYGLQRVKDGDHWRLEIEESEAQIVRQIYEWYVYGEIPGQPLSLFEIARKLTLSGILPPGKLPRFRFHLSTERFKSKTWNTTTIRLILTNETYIGVWYYNRRTVKNKKVVERPRNEWIPVKAPAIVDAPVFKLAQKRIRHNRHFTQPNPVNHYLMHGRLRCFHCGASVPASSHPSHGKLFPYYECPHKSVGVRDNDRKTPECAKIRTRSELLDKKVWEWLGTILVQPDNLLRGLRAVQSEQERATGILKERNAIIQREINKRRDKIAKLVDLYSEDRLPREILIEKQDELQREIAAFEAEYEQNQEKVQNVVISDEAIQAIATISAQFRDAIEQATFDEKRALIELLDVRGTMKAIENDQIALSLSCMVESGAMFIIKRLWRDHKRSDNPTETGEKTAEKDDLLESETKTRLRYPRTA